MTPGLIDHLTDRLSGRFVTDYLALVRRCLVGAIRLPTRHLVSETFATQLRYNLLYRLNSVLKRRSGVKSATLDAFAQVRTRPVARLRQPFGNDRAEVCFISLILDSSPTPLPMSKLVLGRVDPLLVKRYSHGGFSEAHIPWSTESSLDVPASSPEWVTLFDTPVSGNVLQYLFTETLGVFKAISGKQAGGLERSGVPDDPGE